MQFVDEMASHAAMHIVSPLLHRDFNPPTQVEVEAQFTDPEDMDPQEYLLRSWTHASGVRGECVTTRPSYYSPTRSHKMTEIKYVKSSLNSNCIT